MSLFEFLMVLMSIIIGLGIAEVLTGVARVIRERAQLRYYRVHGVLVAITFMALVQQWWEAWSLRTVPSWSFGAMRPVWLLGILAVVGSTGFRPLFAGEALFSAGNATSFFGLVVFAVLYASQRRQVHAVLVPMVLVALVYDVLRWTPEIGG